MNNQEKIAELFRLFDDGQIESAEALAESIRRNFDIADDEYTFELVCGIHYPNKKASEELIASGREH